MNLAIDSLDEEEELRGRLLQGLSGIGGIPPASYSNTPTGFSPISSIAKVQGKESLPQHRPVLSPPKHVMIDVIDSHLKTEQLSAKSAEIFDAEISQMLVEIDGLSAEKQQTLEEEAKNAMARATWSILSLVAQYVSSVGMIVLGAACGGWPAALLIGAGIIGIGNRIIHDTNFLQAAVAWYTKSEELQHKIAQNIEMGAFFLQLGLGLAGGIWAWQAGALAATEINAFKGIESIITGASTVMSAGAKIGMSYYDKKNAYLKARMKEIDTQTTLDHQAIYHESTQISKMIESTQTQTDEIRKSVQTLQVSPD